MLTVWKSDDFMCETLLFPLKLLAIAMQMKRKYTRLHVDAMQSHADTCKRMEALKIQTFFNAILKIRRYSGMIFAFRHEGDDHDMATFAERLTAARKAANMTQEELADAIHAARNTVSNWERGRNQPDLDTMRLLGQVLHVDFLSDGADTVEAPAGGGTESVPARKPDKKKMLGLCAALAVIVVAAALLIGHSVNMRQTAAVTLTTLQNPAPMIADPAFEDSGLGWEFTFVVTNESDVPFKPRKGLMIFYDGDSIVGNMELDAAFLRGCMYGDTITDTDPAPVYINWGASYPLMTSVELHLYGADEHQHEIELAATVELSQEKPQE